MDRWIPCGGAFLPADVVKWNEAIWEERGRQGKPAKIGAREVVAEVLADDGEWLKLLVRASALVEDPTAHRRAHALAPGTEINRKRRTLERSPTERLPWSDEEVRAALAAERAAALPARTAPPSGKRAKPSGKRRSSARTH